MSSNTTPSYRLNDKSFQVKKELQSLSEASYASTADFATLQNFEKTFAEAEKLIPEKELNDYMDAFERLKFNIDKVIIFLK